MFKKQIRRFVFSYCRNSLKHPTKIHNVSFFVNKGARTIKPAKGPGKAWSLKSNITKLKVTLSNEAIFLAIIKIYKICFVNNFFIL